MRRRDGATVAAASRPSLRPTRDALSVAGQRHDEAGAAVGGRFDRRRCRPSRPRARARSRGRGRCRPRGRASSRDGVEPLEHVGRRRRRGMPGPSSATTTATVVAVAVPVDTVDGRASRTSTRSPRGWRRSGRAVRDRARPASGVAAAARCSSTPSSWACGANASAASRTTSAASHGRGFSENWRLSRRERSRRSRTSRSSRRASPLMTVAARLRASGSASSSVPSASASA